MAGGINISNGAARAACLYATETLALLTERDLISTEDATALRNKILAQFRPLPLGGNDDTAGDLVEKDVLV